MARLVSLYLPTWPTDRMRRMLGAAAPPVDAPLVLAGREGRRRVVLAADAAARAAGLRPGMPATQAQALVPGLRLMDADPGADAQALERLALWALRRYAPIAAVDPPDGIVIDVAGATHLHGGEDALLKDAVARMAASGVAARAALAGTWGAAHALARFAARPTLVIPQGEHAKAILDLPLAALRLSYSVAEGLLLLGFESIGDLEATARAPLALRFGPEPGRRLDQAMGRLSEPIEPARPPEWIEVRRGFSEPIGAPETIARYIGLLAVELCGKLAEKGLGARRLDLLFHRVDNRIEAVRAGLALPSRDAKRLARLLRDKIETVDPGFGVEIMSLAASVAEPLCERQTTSCLTDAPEADVSDLIDLVSNRVGEGRVYRFAVRESDVPERSVARIPPLAPNPRKDWPTCWPRPSRLLRAPEAIDVMALLPDHPPVSFTWRGVRRRVKNADGPERIFGEWWTREAERAAARDYFQVEDEAGERFWIYRAGDGEESATGSQRWFLHGMFG